MKDLIEWSEGKGREDTMESRNSIYKSMEVRNKTIYITSWFSMAGEEQMGTRGNGMRKEEKVWLEHDIKRHLKQWTKFLSNTLSTPTKKIRLSGDGFQICAYFRSSLSNSNVFPLVGAPAISNGGAKMD